MGGGTGTDGGGRQSLVIKKDLFWGGVPKTTKTAQCPIIKKLGSNKQLDRAKGKNFRPMCLGGVIGIPTRHRMERERRRNERQGIGACKRWGENPGRTALYLPGRIRDEGWKGLTV